MKQLCNHKVWDFAMALQAQIFSRTFEKLAPVQKGSQRGIFFRLQVYETKGVGGILQVEVYEQVGKTVI